MTETIDWLEIRHRETGAWLHTVRRDRVYCSKVDLSGANLANENLQDATFVDCNLSGANLAGANLFGTNLSGANLTGADLTGARLDAAYMVHANLTNANLTDASLRSVILSLAVARDANMSRVDLGLAVVRCVDFSTANLDGVRPAWTSHCLLAELLRRAAGDVETRHDFANLVDHNRTWCWPQFLMCGHPALEWALETLTDFYQPSEDENTPQEIIRRWRLRQQPTES